MYRDIPVNLYHAPNISRYLKRNLSESFLAIWNQIAQGEFSVRYSSDEITSAVSECSCLRLSNRREQQETDRTRVDNVTAIIETMDCSNLMNQQGDSANILFELGQLGGIASQPIVTGWGFAI